MLLLPLLYGALLFAPTLWSGFLRDDFTWVGNAIDVPRHPELLVGPPNKDFRPMASLAFQLNFALSGLNPAGYYLMNLLLHLANTALVMRLAHRLTGGRRGVVLVTGALFAGAFGNYGDAVVWISGRTGLIVDLFLLGTVLAYWRFLDSGRGRDYTLALALYTLALLSKETAVVVIPLLALIEWARGAPAKSLLRAPALRAYAPFALVLAAYLAFQLGVVRRGSHVIGREYLLGWHVLTNLLESLARMALPLNATSSMVPMPMALRAPLQSALSVLTVLVPMGWAALLFTRVPRWVKFAVLWMVLNLLPYVFFAGRTNTRYLYNPSIGLCLLVAGGIAWWHERAARSPRALRRRLPAIAVAGLLVVQASVESLVVQQRRLQTRREEKNGMQGLREKLEAARRPAPP